ncbi:MAG: pyridoxal phosphate-dependent decarboxylase family protein [Acidimicrobiales bacterium]
MAPKRANSASHHESNHLADPMASSSGSFAWHPEPQLIGYRDLNARAALEELGSAAWHVALKYLYEEESRRPVAPESYSEVRHHLFGEQGFPDRAPLNPTSSAEVLREFEHRLAPRQFNSAHPRAFAYFTPPPLVMSIVGELLAQWLNQSVDLWQAAPSATLIEEEVVAWLLDLLGTSRVGWGVLTSGGIMSNIMAMTLARDIHLTRLLGLPKGKRPRGKALEHVRVYTSDQAHFSIARALNILGFPSETLHLVPSDGLFRLQADPVAEAISADRMVGHLPLAIVATAGSTNTGSVDGITSLAALSAREGLWLHVDAAYGGAALLSGRDRHRVPGLDLADSVAIDPHKWFFQPCDIAALLVRRREDLRSCFWSRPEYYRASQSSEAALNWYEYSIEGTRRFRALKLWMSWKHLGTTGLGRLVEQNNDLAAYLSRRVSDSPMFEAVPPQPELSVVCFRHLPHGTQNAEGENPDKVDRHQELLQRALAISGEAWVSTTRLRGRTYLRAGILNYFSTEDDIDRLLEALIHLGSDLWAP